MRKRFYVVIGFIALILLLIFSYIVAPSTMSSLQFYVTAQDGVSVEQVHVFNSKDGDVYVFLPSYAKMEQVMIGLNNAHRFVLNGLKLSDGMTCSQFQTETPYRLESGWMRSTTLWFYQSQNVSTIYIETASGNMEWIHKDQNYKEMISMKVYTSDGEINYQGSTDSIKGRGNATWTLAKRPYTLTLDKAADLLGMGEGQKWVLLANALDQTNLNNYLVNYLAASVGMEGTPECRFVDLYLNNQYNGLYLLTEKVEVGEKRLDIGASSDSFLCRVDLAERWGKLKNPFLTDLGRVVEIGYPETLSEWEALEIKEKTDQLETIISSDADLSAEACFDLDSWVCRYLLDEISGNIDSDLASSYFYHVNGVFYAGPVWDYDLTFGNSERNQFSSAFIAKNAQKSDFLWSPYYASLYRNSSFYNRMVALYETEFLPVLQQLISTDFDRIVAEIDASSKMDALRWEVTQSSNFVCTTAGLKSYICDRVDFLNRAWLGNEEFCTVQIKTAESVPYLTMSVEKGTYPKDMQVDFLTSEWMISETGEIFDVSKPITEDVILMRVSSNQIGTGESSWQLIDTTQLITRDYVAIAYNTVLIVLFATLGVVSIVQRKNERRVHRGRKQDKVSP